MAVAPFLAEVSAAVGEHAVVTDPDVVAAHVVDWTGRWRGRSPAVLRPTTVEHVAAIVAAARRHRTALVPQGGNTGLVGGAVPVDDEVVLDLRGLDELGEVDLPARQVTTGAGVTLARLQDHTASAGLMPGVDLAARDTATVGGMVATNAGGVHVARHGSMRAQLLGVEAVLGTGDVVRVNLSGLVKDNTGYDLGGLLCGSEGTLGVVTAARLRLVAAPPHRVVALVGFGSVDAAVGALPVLRSMPDLHAVELVLADGVDLVAAHLGQSFPLQPTPAAAILVELAGAGDGLLDALGSALQALGAAVTSTAVAGDHAGAAGLWRWRDAHPEAAAAAGLVHKADVTLPVAAMAPFVAEVGRQVERVAAGATVIVYGHLADGNLHVNIVGPDAQDDAAVAAVLDLTLSHDGSVSAEHGIGTAKRGWLVAQRGEAAVDAMRRIKMAFDPDRILNPRVLLPGR